MCYCTSTNTDENEEHDMDTYEALKNLFAIIGVIFTIWLFGSLIYLSVVVFKERAGR